MSSAPFTAEELATFARDGYVVRRNFFTPEEMSALQACLEEDPAIRDRAYGLADGKGGRTQISAWHDPGADSFGAAARSRKLVAATEALLGGVVAHYHSKVTLKRPGAGGTWLWHQDYGYWYKYGYLFPTMLAVAIPLTPMSEENGGLKVLRGSHAMGRIEHGFIGTQVGADPSRVERIQQTCATEYFEAQPGDVMWFHGNMIHSSEDNRADYARNLFLVCYNLASNVSYLQGPDHAIDVLDDSEIVARRDVRMGERRVFVDTKSDSIMEEFRQLTTTG
jgi:hypothetical protein